MLLLNIIQYTIYNLILFYLILYYIIVGSLGLSLFGLARIRAHPPYAHHITNQPSNAIAQHIASPPISSLAFSFFGTSMLSALHNLINCFIVRFVLEYKVCEYNSVWFEKSFSVRVGIVRYRICFARSVVMIANPYLALVRFGQFFYCEHFTLFHFA